eukprot:1153104-Pelagomonas_calceolata.AAC.1
MDWKFRGVRSGLHNEKKGNRKGRRRACKQGTAICAPTRGSGRCNALFAHPERALNALFARPLVAAENALHCLRALNAH